MTMKEESIKQLANTVYDLQQANNQVIMIICGGTGYGKSHLGIKMCQAVAKRNNLPFSFKNNMTLDTVQLVEWWQGDDNGDTMLPRYSSVDLDELIGNAMNINWAKKKQKQLIELINKGRKRRNLFLVGCVPYFTDINPKLRKHVDIRIEIIYRDTVKKFAIAHILTRSDNYQSKDPWYIDDNEKILRKWNAPQRQEGFVGKLKFTPLPEDVEAEYELWSSQHKVEEEEENDDRVKLLYGQRCRLVKALKGEGMHRELIGRIMGVTPRRVSQILKEGGQQNE